MTSNVFTRHFFQIFIESLSGFFFHFKELFSSSVLSFFFKSGLSQFYVNCLYYFYLAVYL